ncbi:MAG: NADH-quinone oxidoreductase subunit N [Roseiflexaceae bacterium]
MAFPSIDFMMIIQLVIVLAGATILLVVDLFIPAGRKRITAVLALAITVAALVAGNYATTGTTLSAMIGFGAVSHAVNTLILAATALSILLASDALPKHGIERSETYVLMLLATGGMLLLSQGTSLATLFLGLELLSIALYVLTAIAFPDVASEEAGLKYLIVGSFGAGFLVFGIALTFGATGTLMLSEIAAKIPQNGIERGYFWVGVSMMLVGFGYKVSLVPFHMWTPDVYQGAPTPITAYMSVGSKVAGFIAIVSVLQVLGSELTTLRPVLMALSIASMLVGSIVAINQQSLKRMLAYSSISHAGFVMMAILNGTPASIEAAIFYLTAYTVTNLAAFAVLMVLENNDTDLTIGNLGGLWQRNPGLSAVMALALLSLAGVPPTAGFFAKFLVISTAWQNGIAWVAVAAAVSSAIGAFFYVRCLIQMLSGHSDVAPARIPVSTLIVVIAVSVAIVLGGLMPASVTAALALAQ